MAKKEEKVSKESLNIPEEKIEELKKIIPEVFTEGKIDIEKLQRTLGQEINEKDEKYSFNWAGRKETFKNIQTTAKGTLKPAEKESVNWDSTENLFIEGDNLEVLKLLQKAYFNKIKMIYIDPPYNTGGDFVYRDNFKNSIRSYLEQTGQLNGNGFKLTTNPETNGRYHSDWISMIYSRLFIARNLLQEQGIIFVSIDDHEVHNLRMIMNDIFGEENFLQEIIWKKRAGAPNDKIIAANHEYILMYAKNKEEVVLYQKPRSEEQLSRYKNPDNHHKGAWASDNLMANVKGGRFVKSLYFPIINPNTGEEHYPSSNGNWRFNKEKIDRLLSNNEIFFGIDGKGRPKLKRFLCDVKDGVPFATIWDKTPFNNSATKEIENIFGSVNVFETPKPTGLIQEMLKLSTSNSDIVLDFFAGSCSTAQAVIQQNREDGSRRKFICVQIPEKLGIESHAFRSGFKTISDIGKERIKRVIKKLAENDKKEKKQTKLDKKIHSLDLGFKVFKLDKSNYKIWEKYEGQDAKELKKQLELFKTPLISGYKNEDVIYECIIKEGYSLNSKIEKTDVKSNKVFKVIDGELSFYISLDQEIKDKTIDELKLKKEDLFICLDEALNDSKKKNLSIQCNLKTI